MNDPAAKLSRARQLLAQGKAQQALADLRRAAQQAPGNPDVSNAMAVVLMALGQVEQAAYHARRAVEARPDDASHLVNLGMCLGAGGKTDEAFGCFLRAAELAPRMPAARQGMAHILRSRSAWTAAAGLLEKALTRHEADAALASLYAAVLTNLARVSDSVAFTRGWLSRHSDLQVMIAHANAMTYCAGVEPGEVFDAHVAFGRMLEASVPRAFADHANDPDPERAVRVGVLSHDLRRHAVATFLEPWIAGHDAGAIHLICYACSPVQDEVTARLKDAAQGWVDASGMADAALADRIRADRIDILLEATGLNQGQRLAVMAMKPAPVQATMIGYLNTLGLRAIDYRIVDVHTDPPGAERFSVERLARMEPTCWCYRAPSEAPGTERGADDGSVVFGSFNSAAKINERVIALWGSILRAVPRSRLLLKAFDFADAGLRESMVGRFAREGIGSGRVEVEGPTVGMGAFLANYQRVDIALDTFPFNGTTTTLDALWMGVPVVALEGKMHAGRTGVSILRTLGMPGLVGADEEAYARIAAELAEDAERRAELRGTLRQRVAGSALCDDRGFAQRMDAALREMWREWCAGRPAGGR